MRYLPLFILIIIACSPLRKTTSQLQSAVADRGGFQGLEVVDLATGKTVVAQNAQRYFTPASTTKLLTFAVADPLLGSAPVPWLRFRESGDSLFIKGTGHPGYQYRLSNLAGDDFPDDYFAPGAGFLDRANSLWYCPQSVEAYGPGWAWDDSAYRFQRRRAAFPIAGNEMTLFWRDTSELVIAPQVSWLPTALPLVEDTAKVVLPLTDELLIDHLRVRTGRKWELGCPENGFADDDLLVSVLPTDSLWRRVLTHSDNFLAEQLWLTAMDRRFGQFNSPQELEHAAYLPRSERRYQWYDASGLSRYNQLTPHQLTRVLQTIWEKQPRARLQHLLAKNGESGTLHHWETKYAPFFYGKTGSMRGVYCLAGYLHTQSGRWLSVVVMNQHFSGSKREMEQQVWRYCVELHEHL